MSIYQMIPFNNTLVKKFLNWKQSDEDDNWRNKAFETLIKKLKKSDPEGYKILESVLAKKSEDTQCIALSRSQDGRLQVSHRKMLPHVMYCRIFRWPDLLSQHELKSSPRCQYPPNKRDTKVCVNPYHYNRVEHSVYPPVVTPRSDTDFVNASPPPQSPQSPNPAYALQQGSPTYLALTQTQVPLPAHDQRFNSYQALQSDSFGYLNNGNPVQHNQGVSCHPMNFAYSSQSPMSDAGYYPCGPNGSGPIVSVAESPRISQTFESQSPPPSYASRSDQHSRNSMMPMDAADETQSTHVPFSGIEEHRDAWCRIQYSELNQKVGEPFKSGSPQVLVDGYTNPSTNDQSRFSLGVLSNINRNSTIESTRRAIRKGICLENISGQIFVKNLSDSSIFFHSKNCNVENQLNQHAVVKIEPQKRQKIFEPRVFEALVHEIMQSQEADSYQRLFSLFEHCTIKMSFVKGWGSIYQRQDVTSTPCWIEIILTKPAALIDQYLRQVNPPNLNITSTS